MAITGHATLKFQLATQDVATMLAGLLSGDLTVTGRDFTLHRQYCTARKLTKSHGIITEVENASGNLRIFQFLLFSVFQYERLPKQTLSNRFPAIRSLD